MRISLYEAVSDWLYRNEIVVLELPKGGYIQNVNGWLQVYDEDGNHRGECTLTSENLRELLK